MILSFNFLIRGQLELTKFGIIFWISLLAAFPSSFPNLGQVNRIQCPFIGILSRHRHSPDQKQPRQYLSPFISTLPGQQPTTTGSSNPPQQITALYHQLLMADHRRWRHFSSRDGRNHMFRDFFNEVAKEPRMILYFISHLPSWFP